jgi:hypothetical protein
MGTIEVVDILKALRGERTRALKEVAKLDKAIDSLRQLSSSNGTGSAHGRVRTMSAAARRKIAKAQRARWAKLRKEQKKAQ